MTSSGLVIVLALVIALCVEFVSLCVEVDGAVTDKLRRRS